MNPVVNYYLESNLLDLHLLRLQQCDVASANLARKRYLGFDEIYEREAERRSILVGLNLFRHVKESKALLPGHVAHVQTCDCTCVN